MTPSRGRSAAICFGSGETLLWRNRTALVHWLADYTHRRDKSPAAVGATQRAPARGLSAAGRAACGGRYRTPAGHQQA